ncbi:hypothetical protein Q428_13090 [Fervidicella metallireducens AeB]|uniref:Uncharacterized protein n=1 Tax=Fervidicella metallireducens AeB TaxID=1403537 RepID=A0A017RSP6_9CLOT|nr:hypothetical protein Q428_13090 [Fervidicella metallireducens AeB]
MQENNEIFEEIIEILKYNHEKLDFVEKEIDLGFSCHLYLHCRENKKIFLKLSYKKFKVANNISNMKNLS